MSRKPKISIIVPIYNAEQYLERCMESIYAQTLDDYEIILVNDGSKDNSASLCQSYQAKDARIIFINKENEGAGSARNAGIKVARGKYLAFPDADDWFEANMYEELYSLAESGDYDVVFSGVNYYCPIETKVPQYSRTVCCETKAFDTKAECRNGVMTYFPTSTIFDVPWNKLYKRDVIIENNIRFSNMRRCQDAMFNLDFYNCVNKVASIDKAYYNYVENTTEGIYKKFPKNYIDINVAYMTRLIYLLDSWGIYEQEIKKHYDTTYVLAVYETMEMFENPYWALERKEKKQYVLNIMNHPQIQEFLTTAEIRDDVKTQAAVFQERNYTKFIMRYKKSKIKKRLRKNQFIVKMYYLLKGKL